MAFGASLFERRLASAQQAEAQARVQAEADKDRSERQFQKNLELAKFYRDREDAQFDRQLRLAELRGKFLGTLGRPQESEGDFRLQEAQDVGYLGGEAEALSSQQKFDLQQQKDVEAEQRMLASLGVRLDIAGGNLSQRQGAQSELEKFRRDQLAQQQAQFAKRMRLGWANYKKPSSTNIVMGNNPYFKVETDLRKEFEGGKTAKNFREAAAQVGKIQSATDDGVGDMGLIFAYMKMLDPESTVREGEYATAANAGAGVDDRIIRWYNRAIDGDILPPNVRQRFKQESLKLYGAHKSAYEAQAEDFRRVAKGAGANPANVIFDVAAPDPENDLVDQIMREMAEE